MNNRILPSIPVGLAFIFLLGSCIQKNPSVNFIPAEHVYDIGFRNDSVWYSTLENGIFCFKGSNPEKQLISLSLSRMPFRTLEFLSDGTILTLSYEAGVFKVGPDSLYAKPGWECPGWSMKQDNNGKIWIAGRSGVYRQQGDSLALFGPLREVHDLALSDSLLATATANGLAFSPIANFKEVRREFREINLWCVERYGNKWIAGGDGCCIIIDNNNTRLATVGAKGTMVWRTAMDKTGVLWIASTSGIWTLKPGGSKADPVGSQGLCIKTIKIDPKGMIWAGTFK